MTGLKIGVVKPDWGVSGGFERLLDRLLTHLTASGHDLREERFPALITRRSSWGVSASHAAWTEHPEFFRYMALAEDVRRLDLSDYDLVISTQPPSYLADHPRVLSLFYHQARIFYDLAEPFVELGEVDPARHRAASKIIRATDQALTSGVRHWLAGSQECASRLDEFWAITENVSLLHAPPLTDVPDQPPPWNRHGPVLCVSRHEWPKRTEFMVAAAHLMGERRVELVGAGGRLDALTALDARMTASTGSATELDPQQLWMTSALDVVGPPPGTPNTTRLLGNVSDDQRDACYRAASVVVAPAYREDYGLTALEAMLWQRPLIVCSDGGGLVDIVNDTGAGIVVDPTPAAIAEGVRRITESPQLAADLIERCKAVPTSYTWERCHRELDDAVERAMSATI